MPELLFEAPEHTELLSARELGTVLAALRFWQLGSHNAHADIREIATEAGTFEALDGVEIDELCARLNLGA